MNFKTITANEGFVWKRKHDGFIMDKEIHLGYDFSTGVKREDKQTYYEQVEKPKEELEIEGRNRTLNLKEKRR